MEGWEMFRERTDLQVESTAETKTEMREEACDYEQPRGDETRYH